MEAAFLNAPAPLWGRLALLLFPAFCVECGAAAENAAQGSLCGACWSSVTLLNGSDGGRQGSRFSFDSLSCAASYEGAMRSAVHAWKFGGKTTFRRPFAALLRPLLNDAGPRNFLAFPPTAAASLKERGFDAAQELAHDLARHASLPLYRGLRRRREGVKQASLEREARWQNAQGAYQAGDDAKGKNFLLVDDVVTTGATLSACAAALKTAGAARVDCIALASGELRGTN